MQLVQEIPAVGRRMRRPSHRFQLRTLPYQIQPFMIAPVLPGETMKNLLLQARVVSDPIKNPLIGWWQEYYFFYVKHRDLAAKDQLVDLMLNPGVTLTAAAAKVETYHPGGTIDYAQQCLDAVVKYFFRNEDERLQTYNIGNLPQAAAIANEDSWLDSVLGGSAMPETPLPDTGQTSTDIDAKMQQWEWMRSMKLIDMTYEDWLRTFGVTLPKEQAGIPELIRYVKDWTYPSNTINPADGAPSSAVSWAIAERADKDRFFKEPGFVFGVSVTRPKIYWSKQTGAAVSLLSDAFSWLPAIMRDEPYTSLKKVATGAGILPSITDVKGYWVDVRDLFLYGDQFVNFGLTATDAGFVALPTPALQKRFVAQADIDALFKVGTSNKIKQDGVCQLAILGAQVDHT